MKQKKSVVEENMELAIDWFNGRRTPDANQALKGAISGLNLASDAPAIFRAVTESTCFGAKAIVDRFISEGIPIKGLDRSGRCCQKISLYYAADGRYNGNGHTHSQIGTNLCAGCCNVCSYGGGIYQKVEAAMQAMGTGF